MKKKVLLVDGNALYFKAFWGSYIRIKDGAGPRLADGTPVNALATFAFMVMNLKERFSSEKILIAFDERGGHTHRHQYDFYKAGRKEQPQELYSQIPLVKEFLDHYGVKWHSKKELEADDIIGILSRVSVVNGYEVDIITTDKDLLQLVDHEVRVHISKSGVTDMELYSMENFREKFFNLEPRHIVEFKGVAGDSSDNLAGIKGIGEKTAVKLILEHDSMECIIDNMDSYTPGLKSKIQEGKDMGLLCRELAKILTEGDVQITLDELDVQRPDFESLERFFAEMPINNVPNKLRKERASLDEEDGVIFEKFDF